MKSVIFVDALYNPIHPMYPCIVSAYYTLIEMDKHDTNQPASAEGLAAKGHERPGLQFVYPRLDEAKNPLVVK